jgi:SAM-dependent methyltransferase
MKTEWVELLCDPYDRTPVRLADGAEQRDGRVISGTLISESGRKYEIREGIPVMLAEGMQLKESVESFAFEWDEFGFLFAKNGWLKDLIGPLVGSDEFFRGKVVVDAGAGSGAQTRWIADAGASLVYSLELSDVIFRRHRESVGPVADRVFAIQADIAHPPVRNAVDVVYCINVAQHTADPRRTFAALGRLVRAGGTFLFNIYTKRSEVKFQVVRAVRTVVRFMPFRAWKAAAFLIAAVGYPLAKVRFLNRTVRIFVPISHSFRETWLDVYDAFGPHWYQQNMRVDDQHKMIAQERFTIERQTPFGYVLKK